MVNVRQPRPPATPPCASRCARRAHVRQTLAGMSPVGTGNGGGRKRLGDQGPRLLGYLRGAHQDLALARSVLSRDVDRDV
jgi:hypothetical protein